MELTNNFTIDRPVGETWKVLTDLEFIAPCMPGAQLTEIEGEEYRGFVKVKVGPISASYKGKARFESQDPETHVAKLKAEGRDPRQGNANAMITATMAAVGDAQTEVSIHTDLSLSGKIASFGRGAIEDVSKKILGQFADNLQDKLEAGGISAASDVGVATSDGAPVVSAAKASEVSNGAAATAPASSGAAASTASPTVRKIDGPEPEPLDLLSVSSNAMLKKSFPAGAGGLLLALLVYILFRRK